MKDYNRRQFIAAASALAAGPAMAAAAPTEDPVVVHHVFFWLKNKGSKTDRDKLVEGLKSLRDIPTVKKLMIGVPAATEMRGVIDNSYDLSELMYFESASDQDAYQVHPVHKAFVEKYSHLWEKVIVYDMQLI